MQFVQNAKTYCSLVETPTAEIRDFAQQLAMILGLLYHGALNLPEDFTEDDLLEEALDTTALAQALRDKFGAHDLYRVVSGLYGDEEAVTVAVLSDDLTDIYRDIKAGLIGYEQGLEDAAIEHWIITFRAHWGMHLVNSLKALQSLLTLRDVA